MNERRKELWEKVHAGTATREEVNELAKYEMEFWERILKKFPDWLLAKLVEDETKVENNPIYALTARELLRRKIMKNIDNVMASKVIGGRASKEEYEAWQLHVQYGIPYNDIVNLDEVMDEDMAYWYERGCPPDDCPGFRGD